MLCLEIIARKCSQCNICYMALSTLSASFHQTNQHYIMLCFFCDNKNQICKWRCVNVGSKIHFPLDKPVSTYLSSMKIVGSLNGPLISILQNTVYTYVCAFRLWWITNRIIKWTIGKVSETSMYVAKAALGSLFHRLTMCEFEQSPPNALIK